MDNRSRLGKCMFVIIYLVLFIPFVVHELSPEIESEITADGMLNYLITCISALGTITLAIVSLKQTERANDMAAKANEMSRKMIDIEKERYKLDNRPFVLVTNWKMIRGDWESIILNPTNINICIGEADALDICCLMIECTNTTNSTLTVMFNACYNKDDSKVTWGTKLVNQHQRKMYILPNERQSFGFYTTKNDWESRFGKTWVMELILENRFGKRYKECYELVLMSMDDHYLGKEDHYFCSASPQEYRLYKFLNSSISVEEQL